MFRHANGRIRIGAFKCDAGEFARIEPDYTGLPAGVIERRYDPAAQGGKPKHVIILDGHRQTGGPVPWPDGDAMLAKAGQYPVLHAVAFPEPGPKAPPPSRKPKAPSRGTTVEKLRQALINAGYFEP